MNEEGKTDVIVADSELEISNSLNEEKRISDVDHIFKLFPQTDWDTIKDLLIMFKEDIENTVKYLNS